MLLVDDYKLKIQNGSKDRASGTHNDPGFASSYPVPFIISLSVGKFAVHNGSRITESTSDPAYSLRRKRDLGDKVDNASSPFEYLSRTFKINFRLAASRYPVKEEHGRMFQILLHLFKGILLI